MNNETLNSNEIIPESDNTLETPVSWQEIVDVLKENVETNREAIQTIQTTFDSLEHRLNVTNSELSKIKEELVRSNTPKNSSEKTVGCLKEIIINILVISLAIGIISEVFSNYLVGWMDGFTITEFSVLMTNQTPIERVPIANINAPVRLTQDNLPELKAGEKVEFDLILYDTNMEYATDKLECEWSIEPYSEAEIQTVEQKNCRFSYVPLPNRTTQTVNVRVKLADRYILWLIRLPHTFNKVPPISMEFKLDPAEKQ
jgi:hypothetical protein